MQIFVKTLTGEYGCRGKPWFMQRVSDGRRGYRKCERSEEEAILSTRHDGEEDNTSREG